MLLLKVNSILNVVLPHLNLRLICLACVLFEFVTLGLVGYAGKALHILKLNIKNSSVITFMLQLLYT